MLSRGRGARDGYDVQGLRSLQALSKQVKALEEIQSTAFSGIGRGSSGLKGQKVTSRPRSFLQMHGIPVNRFSGTVLEHGNKAIFGAFGRFWGRPAGRNVSIPESRSRSKSV
jgi:hypothetical protein